MAVRGHCWTTVQFWCLCIKRDADKLERTQKNKTKQKTTTTVEIIRHLETVLHSEVN